MITYSVIGEPLFDDGAVQLTVALPVPAFALTFVGAVGAPAVVAFDAGDAGPVPTTFLAATLNVYVVPFVKPVMVWVVAVELNVTGGCGVVPTKGVITYPVIGEPFDDGAVHDIVADAFPGDAVGAPGASATSATFVNVTLVAVYATFQCQSDC